MFTLLNTLLRRTDLSNVLSDLEPQRAADLFARFFHKIAKLTEGFSGESPEGRPGDL